MCYIFLTIILITVNQCATEDAVFKPSPTPFQDWDYLVYSQRWPITSCAQWIEKSSKNTCDLPQNNLSWTVHGVWPTKIGANGPFFCNSAMHFDPQQLDPFMDELQVYWTNVENNTAPYSFWQHEWNKHGTCASVLPQLNSVTNFFKMGLKLNQVYDLSQMLTKFNIIPNNDGYNISDVFNAVKTSTGKLPSVECIVDNKQSMISEIRLCFNKNFDLIDCNSKSDKGWADDVLGNCAEKKTVMYFPNVPQKMTNDDYLDEKCLEKTNNMNLLLFKIYHAIKFLMWFTL